MNRSEIDRMSLEIVRPAPQEITQGMDAAVPVDAENAPTRDLENRTERGFPQRPHPSSFFILNVSIPILSDKTLDSSTSSQRPKRTLFLND